MMKKWKTLQPRCGCFYSEANTPGYARGDVIEHLWCSFFRLNEFRMDRRAVKEHR